jgi:hypothetical protein
MQDYSQILTARGWASPQKPAPPIADEDYHARVEAALGAVCRPDYPAGMILWLEKRDPVLYDDLTCRLPDLIDWLWNAHAPLEEFQRIVKSWLASHRRASELYRRQMSGRRAAAAATVQAR